MQSSHTGLRSRLWKVVTVDGVETERTLLNKDTYNASKAVYRVGPEAPVNAPVQTDPAGGQTAGAGENTSPESPGAENVAGGPGMPGESGTVPGGGPGAPAGRHKRQRGGLRRSGSTGGCRRKQRSSFRWRPRSIARGRRQCSSSGRWPGSSRPIREVAQ